MTPPWTAIVATARTVRKTRSASVSKAVLRRRADQLAELLDLDVARVRGWAYAQAVLSAAWHVEDGEDPSFSLAVAELLEPLTRGR